MTRIVARLPDESADYRKIRQELLEAEIALREQTIAVAALRRELPLDTEVEDYLFARGPADLDRDGPVEQVSLSELFVSPDKPLIVYHFMYGAAQTTPCPMCTMWLDGFNGIVRHVTQRANLAVVAAAPIRQLRTYARHRGWSNLPLLSSASCTFKTDLQTQTPQGGQRPAISVFSKADGGTVRHFYTGEPTLDENTWGGLDQYCPVWNLFDLTPQGREDWNPQLDYR
jgi:predicted dithiol-disulfide oxidoreductase (DUF899 family)